MRVLTALFVPVNREKQRAVSGLCARSGLKKNFDQSGTIVTLLHLINNWQMNPGRKPTLLADSLLSACIMGFRVAKTLP
jgi:hypothetical protein